MDWTDRGIILGTRRFGESGLIVEAMTAEHGRHLGLVRGGRGRRFGPLLQCGNTVLLSWRARLEDHLGAYAVEAERMRAAELIEAPWRLDVVQTLAAHLRLLPERDPHPALFTASTILLDHLEDEELALALLVRLELRLLEELGFGLDMARCAVSGMSEGLTHVSPNTGRAVTQAVAEPYLERLLALPAFLKDSRAGAERADLAAGLALTGHFLRRHVWEPRLVGEPDTRMTIRARLGRGDA